MSAHLAELARQAGESAGAATSTTGTDLAAVLWFAGALAGLTVFVGVISGRVFASESRFRTFGRLFALIAVAGLGTALAFSNVSDAAKTAAFTLLGTIAGFLASVTNSSETTSDSGTASKPSTRSVL